MMSDKMFREIAAAHEADHLQFMSRSGPPLPKSHDHRGELLVAYGVLKEESERLKEENTAIQLAVLEGMSALHKALPPKTRKP